jgi:hypothetical protein
VGEPPWASRRGRAAVGELRRPVVSPRDTAGMWTLIRLFALALLAVLALLVAGAGEAVYAGAADLAGRLGLDLPAREPAGLEAGVVIGGLLVGLVLSAPRGRGIGGATSHAVTLLHELGHVLIAAACGARPAGIVLSHDASGHATSRWTQRRGPLARAQRAATAFFGYPAPATFSAAGAAMLVGFGPRAVLWSLAGAAALVAVLARSGWTFLVAGALGAVAVVSLSERAAPYAVGVAVAVLVAVAVHNAILEVRRSFRPMSGGHDAFAVRREIAIPARLTMTVQSLWTVAAAGWTLWLIHRAVG